MQRQGIRKVAGWSVAGLVSMLATVPAEAEVPRVAVDLPAVHSLVSAVMGDLGEPAFLMQPGASPHSYSLRPSEARTLARAEVIFWVSGTLSPWLAEAIANLNPEAESVALVEAPATRWLEFRQTAVFGDPGAGGHGHHGADSHGESGPGNQESGARQDQNGHEVGGAHGAPAHRAQVEQNGARLDQHREHREQEEQREEPGNHREPEEEHREPKNHAGHGAPAGLRTPESRPPHDGEHGEHGEHGERDEHGEHDAYGEHGKHGDPSDHGSHREHEAPPHGSAEKESRHGHGPPAELSEEGEHGHHENEHGPHGDDAGGHEDHGAAHARAEPAHAEHGAPDPAGHGHEHGGRSHEVGGHELLHAHQGIDPHAWLDPVNGMVWLGVIADVLAERDPAHAALYEANAAAAREKLQGLLAELEATLQPVRGRGFVVFHDSFQYFENRFGVEAVGAISFADASAPGPRRLQEVREAIAAAGVRCVLAEPQFDPGLVETVAEGQGVRVREIDPLGVGLEPGPELYAELLQGVAGTLVECLRE
jgi:zinc transport system substrate-binding protein